MIIIYDRVIGHRSPAVRPDDFRISRVAEAAYFGGYGNEQDGAA